MNDHLGEKQENTAWKKVSKSTYASMRITGKRIGMAANERGISPRLLVISAALEVVEEREWPRTEAKTYLLRLAMFAVPTIIRDMEREGREKEIEQISRNISQVAPELPGKLNGSVISNMETEKPGNHMFN